MELMGMPLPPASGKGPGQGGGGLRELKDAKNVALVMVTATVSAGAQRGDTVDCHVSAISAKSLVGGRLFMTPLVGPDLKSRRVFALAQGQLDLDDAKTMPVAAKIHKGVRLEEDFPGPDFARDRKLVLILNADRADYQVAADIAELISTQVLSTEEGDKARAIDHARIEVPIPKVYLERRTEGQKVEADPVFFVSQVLSQPIPEPDVEARIVINERANTILVSGDIEIGAVIAQHKNIVVEAGTTTPRFVAIDTERKQQQPGGTRLQGLLDALNAVKVPTEDMIEIIKGLERTGKLHAKVIIE